MGIGNILGSLLGGVISTAVGLDNRIFIMVSLPVISFCVMAGNSLYLKRLEQLPVPAASMPETAPAEIPTGAECPEEVNV